MLINILQLLTLLALLSLPILLAWFLEGEADEMQEQWRRERET
jgi:hypothetical protein